MSAERDPIRLLDPGSGASEALREVLGSSRDDAPTEADLRRLGARVATLGEPPSPGGGGNGGSGAPILPLALIAVGIATLVGGLVWWSGPLAPRDPPTPPARSATADSPPTAGPALTPSVVESPPERTSPAQQQLPPPRGAAPHRSPSHEAHAHGPAPAADVATSTEIDLLGAAQRSLRGGAPRRALELAEEHAARFPAGALVEEREAIAVEALARVGDRGKAAVRYASLVRRFPRSTYRARLQKLVTP